MTSGAELYRDERIDGVFAGLTARDRAVLSDPSAAAERLEEYAKLFQVMRTLASELDLTGISHQIVLCAIDLVNADAGTLYIYDQGTGRLKVQDSVGLGPSIHELSLEPGECAAGKAFFTGKGEIFDDPISVGNVLANASADNLDAFRRATQGLRAPAAAMSAPLSFKGDVVGALVVDKLQGSVGTFTAQELSLLEDLARIAAIGVMNAKLFDLERGTRLRLEVMNDELNRQRDLLDHRARSLDAMANVAREGGGLDATVGRLASLTCGKAMILDGLGRVLAVVPGDQPSASARALEPALAEVLERVNDDRQRHTVEREGARVVVSPIVLEMEVLGTVVLELSDGAMDAVAEALVDSAALIASTILVREQAREEGNLQRRRDLLTRLLNGDAPRTAAQFHELRPPFRLAVGGIRSSTGASRSKHAVLVRQLKTVTAETIRDRCPTAAIAVRDDHVVVAWSVAGRSDPDRSLLFRDIAGALALPDGWHTRFTLTPPITDPQEVPKFYREARLALDLRPWGVEPVIDVAELGAYRLIIAASTSTEAIESSKRTLQNLLEHENRRGPSLLPTLRTYFSLGMGVTATAKALHIHVHTVQYRLAKAEKLTGLNLRNSAERLTLELSLRVYDLAYEVESPATGE
jgi:GAF domain-containing protein